MNFPDYIVLSYMLPLTIFIGLYAVRSPWRSNELGIALMLQKVGFTLVISVVLMTLFLGTDYAFRQELRTFVYTVVGVALWLDVFNLLRYQYRARHPHDPTKWLSRWAYKYSRPH